MNQNSAMNIVSRYTKVTTLVPEDSYVSGSLPLTARVEGLVEMTIKPESSDTNLAVE